MTERFRMLPSSDMAERGVVCAFLLAPKHVGALCADRKVTAGHFHSPAIGMIFSVLMGFWLQDQPFDVVVLTQTLADRNILEQVGGAGLVSELYTFLPTATLVSQHIDTLLEKSTLRKVIGICTEFGERCYDEQDNVIGLLEEIAAAVSDAAGAGQRKDAKSFKESIFEKLARIEQGKADAGVIRTGLRVLDRESPMHRGDMPMIAGEKKAGKSIMSLTVAMNIANAGQPVLYFSLEDRTEQVIDRIFAGATKIPIVRQNASSLSEFDFPRITMAVGELVELRVQIRDDVFELSQIVAVARQQKTKWPDLAVIFVDYLQLVRGARTKDANREQEVANVSRTLRLLGMELNAAVVVLSQLNEAGKTRESRAIEQDITAAWIVNKPENEEEWNSRRIISVPFQRNGDSGIGFPVAFFGHFARMEDCAQPPAE